MFTGFEGHGEVFTEVQKIWILFHKVYIPILTHIKNILQVSYELYQYKSVAFNFIFNRVVAEESK